ncbi:MAG: diguanylate cyclase [Candidatus Omnitrophota bacterium]
MPELKDKKILLASSDTNCAEIIILLLKSWGYASSWIKESKEVIEAISKLQPDLIIVDSSLGGTDPFNLIKEIKADYHNGHIPILMILEKKNVRRDILEIEQGLDDYLTKPPDPIDLEVRLEMALRRTEHHFFANALSKLPGSRMLEKIIQQKLEHKEIFSFLYCDINNFKSFNDKYGFERGDAVIMQTAHIITNAVKLFGSTNDFVFHIGGDDFVILTSSVSEAAVTKYIIDEFDKLILFHYAPIDRDRGFIRIRDRQGKIVNFPLMAISIAIVNNVDRQINSLIEFVEIAFEIKRYLKQDKHSSSLVNRRKARYDYEIKKEDELKQEARVSSLKKRQIYRPLGQILLEKNLINNQQLESALIKHWSSNRRLGQVLVDMNLIDSKQLEQIFKKSPKHSQAHYVGA